MPWCLGRSWWRNDIEAFARAAASARDRLRTDGHHSAPRRRPERSSGWFDDYARLLGEELSRRGHRVTIGRVLWDKNGSVRSLAAAARRPTAGCWVILQHTHLGWSRWGFPIRILPLAAALRLRGVKVAVIIHDPLPFGGRRARDQVRAFTQIAVMRSLVALADRTLVTVDPSVIRWAGSKGRAALTFAPVGSNVGSAAGPREREASNKVVVFGVTEGHVVEARRISRVARTARSGLRLLSYASLDAERPSRQRSCGASSKGPTSGSLCMAFSRRGMLPRTSRAQTRSCSCGAEPPLVEGPSWPRSRVVRLSWQSVVPRRLRLSRRLG